eukprot:Partr_v1_DN28387_c0_g1_i2_m78347 putative Solute carrier family 38, member 11
MKNPLKMGKPVKEDKIDLIGDEDGPESVGSSTVSLAVPESTTKLASMIEKSVKTTNPLSSSDFADIQVDSQNAGPVMLESPPLKKQKHGDANFQDSDMPEYIHGSGTSTMPQAVINVVNSVLGAGIIGMPFALDEAGFFMGIFCLLAIAGVVNWTLRILIRSAKLSGRTSYQELAEFCFGVAGFRFISVFQFMFAFGGMSAYLVIVGDTLPLVFRKGLSDDPSGFMVFLTSRRLVLILSTLCVIFPLSLYRDITKLAKTSAFALVSLFFILLCIIFVGPRQDESLREVAKLDFIRPNFLQAIGVISFAFVCHHNSFLIYGSLQKPTLDRWGATTHWFTSISCFFSLCLAIPGYLIFGDKVEGNILNNFSHDSGIMTFARFLFGLNMFTTFPLECFVCREVITNYFFRGQHLSYKQHFLMTAALTACCLMIALITCNFGFVLEFTGGFSASFLGYVLPCACFLKVSSSKVLSKKNIF